MLKNQQSVWLLGSFKEGDSEEDEVMIGSIENMNAHLKAGMEEDELLK